MCSMLPSSGTKCLLTLERAHSWRKPARRGAWVLWSVPSGSIRPPLHPGPQSRWQEKARVTMKTPPGWAGSQSFGCDFVLMETLERPLISPPQGAVTTGQPWSVYTIESRWQGKWSAPQRKAGSKPRKMFNKQNDSDVANVFF